MERIPHPTQFVLVRHGRTASAVVGALWAGVSPGAGFAYAAITGTAGALALLRAR